VWEGDSHSTVKSFSEDAQENLGSDLRRVQQGERPLDSRPMKTVGPGVFELRDQDRDFWYRLFYIQIGEVIYALHSFKKKAKKTPPNEINTGRQRLKDLKQRLAKGKKEKR
jgi:phage-related protein